MTSPGGTTTTHHATTSGAYDHRQTLHQQLNPYRCARTLGASSDISQWAGPISIYTDGSGGKHS
eukprot:3556329-Karenia_brevis.AAC.1